jgi:hypothetical protein
MEHYVGLDVSLKLTAICIVDRTGKIEREGVVASDPETIAKLRCVPGCPWSTLRRFDSTFAPWRRPLSRSARQGPQNPYRERRRPRSNAGPHENQMRASRRCQPSNKGLKST